MFIYLASPYSHRNKEIREIRAELATGTAALLISKGVPTYSPITQSVEIAKYLKDKKNTSWKFWKTQDLALLDKSDALIVLTIKGYDKSVGVTAEIEHAKKYRIPVLFMSYDDIAQMDGNSIKSDIISLKLRLGGIYD